MGLIIDTCIFIEIERNPRTIDFNLWDTYGDAYISSITVSELLIGVHRANTKARHLKRSAFVEAILNKLTVLEFTKEAARIHAEIFAHLADKGKLIGAHDLIIAATAIANDCALLTTNHHEFNRVPGLKLLNQQATSVIGHL